MAARPSKSQTRQMCASDAGDSGAGPGVILFGCLNGQLVGRHFAAGEDVRGEVDDRLRLSGMEEMSDKRR
jgi:hypothetical protein